LIVLLSTQTAFSTLPVYVVINELMWAGSEASFADEWLELKNMTDSEISLSGWQLTKNGDGETLMLEIPEGKTIEANGYFLITNYSPDDSKSNIAEMIEPDVTDTAVSLSNTKLQIKLYDGQWDAGATLIDTADDGVGVPAAGSNETPKKSMVRQIPPGDGTDPANWFTANTRWGWKANAEEWGTPGVDNALPVELLSFTAKSTQDGVVLKWRTESEINNAGFNLYSSDKKDGEFVKVNESLIQGAGTTSVPQEYRYFVEVEDGSTLFYFVESVAFDGKTDRTEAIKVVAINKRGNLATLWGKLKNMN
jgi:hypothetical protein